jgi:hypothetical protein
MKGRLVRKLMFNLILGMSLFLGSFPELSFAAKKVSVAYMSYPIHDQQIKWIKKWGEEHGVEIRATPVSYEVYVLTRGTTRIWRKMAGRLCLPNLVSEKLSNFGGTISTYTKSLLLESLAILARRPMGSLWPGKRL